MSRFPALSVLGLCGLVGVLGTASQAHAQHRLFFDPDTVYDVPVDGAPSLGPRDALVTVVEFSDFYCGYCRHASDTVRQLLALYPDEVRLVYVHAPLDPEDGTLAAEAALAAQAQGQFWPMHDRLFSGPPGPDRALVLRYASELGLDVDRFRRDLDGRAQLHELRRQIDVSRGLGVRSTPVFFINGRPIDGARPLGQFAVVIEEELARARQLLADGRVERRDLYRALVENGRKRGSQTPPTEFPFHSVQNGKRYQVGLGLPGHAEGKDDALVTIVEFSDFQCPYCGMAESTLKRLHERFGDDLRIVYRHLPLPMHPDAPLAAEASVEAAQQGKFWPYHDLLFRHQRRLARADLEDYARHLGLDMKRFDAALDSRKHLRAVLGDAAAGAMLGVSGTPTFFINGVALVGNRPYQDFESAVQAELDVARTLVSAGAPRAHIYEDMTNGSVDSVESPVRQRNAPIILGDRDYHVATLEACKNGNGEQARHFLAKIRDARQRASAVADCKKLGVEL